MNNQINCIILDDEPNNINMLKRLLQKHCVYVTIIAEETDTENGLKLINELHPDLVFLDIHMPNMNGFELLKKLEPISFEVIFVTAFGEHALEAFEYHAIGYVTKPIRTDKLIDAVENAQKRIKQKSTAENIFTLFETRMNHHEEMKIALATLNGLIFVNREDIIYCESAGNYTNFYTLQGKKIVVSKQLGEYEKLLPEANFVRIHERFIINLRYVNEYVKGRGGEIKLNNVITLPVSASRKEVLLARFQKWLKQ